MAYGHTSLETAFIILVHQLAEKFRTKSQIQDNLKIHRSNWKRLLLAEQTSNQVYFDWVQNQMCQSNLKNPTWRSGARSVEMITANRFILIEARINGPWSENRGPFQFYIWVMIMRPNWDNLELAPYESSRETIWQSRWKPSVGNQKEA